VVAVPVGNNYVVNERVVFEKRENIQSGNSEVGHAAYSLADHLFRVEMGQEN